MLWRRYWVDLNFIYNFSKINSNKHIMTYQDFINELRPHIEEAKFLFNRDQFDEDPEFRKWRTKTINII